MFKFFQAVKTVKKLKKIEPNKRWLANLRMNFAGIADAASPAGPAFLKTRVAIVAAAVLVLLLSGGGLVNSTQAALPDEALYPIKLLSEKFQEFFIVGNENKVNFALKLAERRLEEAEQRSEKNGASSETIILGTIDRAQNNIKRAEIILTRIADNNEGKEDKEFKKAEKALERLEKLAERKMKLAEKLAKKLPSAAKALDNVKFNSVDIKTEGNKIIITFSTSSMDNASSTPEDDDDDDNNENNNGKKRNRGSEKIIELLTNGAGKSGKIPEGLLKALGIKKKLEGLFEFPDLDDDDDEDDDEDEDENENEDEDEDEDTDTIAPTITNIQTSGISTSTATVSWNTNESSTAKIYYAAAGPVDINNTSTASQSNDTLTTGHSFNLTGLNASTTYFFVAEAKDAADNIATSTETSFITAE